MCKSKMLLSLVVVISMPFVSNAQVDSIPNTKKNEIGLNLTPFAVVILGETPSAKPLELTYKRVYNDWAFRTKFAYTNSKNNPFFDRTEQVLWADSMLSERITTKKREAYTLGVGFEHRSHIKSGIYFVAGIDLLGELTQGRERVNETISQIDSIGSAGTANQFYHTTQLSTNTIFEEDMSSIQFGAGVSLGLLVPVGARWWLQGQFYMSGFVGPTEKTTSDNVAGTTETTQYTTFDLTSGPALAQMSVFYRF
ncbi:MAG: hypothetical protein GC193_00280 [Cryomorphaceae bacterium]|nr:hypothetical protein [Cryomorphaceae bacterium]